MYMHDYSIPRLLDHIGKFLGDVSLRLIGRHPFDQVADALQVGNLAQITNIINLVPGSLETDLNL